MIAFKGFTSQLWSSLGDGKKETCRFTIGETKTVPESKTARNGFHCCENPFDCLAYYRMDGNNRFFKVEAAGDIDEDASQKIACTQITLIEELTTIQFALEGIKYMVEHPLRSDWQQSRGSVQVNADMCEAGAAGHIAIARGYDPCVKGPAGSILGLIVERDEEIQNVKILVVSEDNADRWLRITDEREVEVLEKSES